MLHYDREYYDNYDDDDYNYDLGEPGSVRSDHRGNTAV